MHICFLSSDLKPGIRPNPLLIPCSSNLIADDDSGGPRQTYNNLTEVFYDGKYVLL